MLHYRFLFQSSFLRHSIRKLDCYSYKNYSQQDITFTKGVSDTITTVNIYAATGIITSSTTNANVINYYVFDS
jgi:hypothetical protein